MDTQNLDYFLQEHNDSTSGQLSDRVAFLESENKRLSASVADMQSSMEAIKKVNEKLLTAFGILTAKVGGGVQSAPQSTQWSGLVKSQPPQASVLPALPTTALPSSVPCVSAPTLPLEGPVIVSTPVTLKTEEKNLALSADPLKMSRTDLRRAVAGVTFSGDLDRFVNVIKKDLTKEDLQTGPMDLALRLYRVSKEGINKCVPQGSDVLQYHCKFILKLADFAKQSLPPKAEAPAISLESDEDELLIGMALDLQKPAPPKPVAKEAKPAVKEIRRVEKAAGGEPAAKKQKGEDEWKRKTLLEMNLVPLGNALLALDGAKNLGKSAKILEDQDVMSIVMALKAENDTAWLPAFTRTKALFIRVCIGNDISHISFETCTLRLMKILLRVCLHEIMEGRDSEPALNTVLGSVPGSNLNAKVISLLDYDGDLPKQGCIFDLFQRVAKAMHAKFSMQSAFFPEQVSPTILQVKVKLVMAAPTQFSQLEQLLHVLMAAPDHSQLPAFANPSVLLLGSIFRLDKDQNLLTTFDLNTSAYSCRELLSF